MEQDKGAPQADGLSQAEPKGLGPSGFDPSRVIKCECDNTGQLDPNYADWYDAELELPFVNHAPGECECTNGLARYRSSGGAIRWLCSICHTFGDERLRDSDGSPEGEDALAASSETTARAEGIAPTLSERSGQ